MILTSTLKLLYTIQSITLIHKRENCRIAIIGFHPGQRVIYSPSQYSKTFAPSSLIAISNFKEEKMIHFALNRTMNRGKLCSLHRFTKFVKTSNLPNRSKSGSGSFEAEWKAIGSSSVIRFLQRIRKWTAHRAPSWPVMNRILIAANRSRIAVIRFGLLSIYNEVSSLSSDCTNHCTPIWKITNPFLARLHCHRIEYVPFIIVLFERGELLLLLFLVSCLLLRIKRR